MEALRRYACGLLHRSHSRQPKAVTSHRHHHADGWLIGLVDWLDWLIGLVEWSGSLDMLIGWIGLVDWLEWIG